MHKYFGHMQHAAPGPGLPLVCVGCIWQQFSINNYSAEAVALAVAGFSRGMQRDRGDGAPRLILTSAKLKCNCFCQALCLDCLPKKSPWPPDLPPFLGRPWLRAVNDAATKCRLHMLPLPWEADGRWKWLSMERRGRRQNRHQRRI